MTGASSKIGFLSLVVVILLYNSTVVTGECWRDLNTFILLSDILRSLPWSLTHIEEILPPKLDDLYNLVKKSNSSIALFMDFFDQSRHINEQYTKLNWYKTSTEYDYIRLMNLHSFANLTTRPLVPPSLLDRLERFIGTIIPNSRHGGIFHMYLTYVNNQDDRWCEKRQSVSYFIYSSFRYTLDIIRKGYSAILQSYVIQNAFGAERWISFKMTRILSECLHRDILERHFPYLFPERSNVSMQYFKGKYKSTIKRIFEIFIQLEIGASRMIIPCDPLHQERGITYLEMEKLLQGVLPQEITLNERNSAKGSCEDYKDQGTAYYPYMNIRHDGDWKCHGLVYDCFQIPQNIDICKPVRNHHSDILKGSKLIDILRKSQPSRRLDGVVDNYIETLSIFETRYEGMGKTHGCDSGNKWTLYAWRYPMPFSAYVLEQCACLCDDFEHPKTLRKFSREYVMADYKNNMVVTGIRLVNISNVIHIQIQEGKLEKYGSINPSTVHWRLKNDIVNRSDDLYSRSSDEVVTLYYHKRRVNLGSVYFEPNHVVIGAAFDWDLEKKGVELLVCGTSFSFSTGELSHDYRQRYTPNEPREEIVLEGPDMPELCDNNVPLRGDNKFIKFQTTDWKKDAAQTTIPYLDIQQVVTNPPVMLRGIGLYYKNAAGCGGYIGLELYSHGYEHFIFYNDTLY